MEPVVGLVENRLRVGFKGLFVNFVPAIRRQTVHHERAGPGQLDQRRVDLITTHFLEALGRLGFFAHGNPNVGIEQIGARRGRFDVLGHQNFSSRALEQIGRGLKGRGCRNAQFKTEFGRREGPRVGHIAGAITKKGDRFAPDRPALFLECENVRKDLARVLLVGQRVDGGNAGVAGELFDVALGVGTEDCPVHEAAQHTGGVFDRLAPAKLNLVRRKKN